ANRRVGFVQRLQPVVERMCDPFELAAGLDRQMHSEVAAADGAEPLFDALDGAIEPGAEADIDQLERDQRRDQHDDGEIDPQRRPDAAGIPRLEPDLHDFGAVVPGPDWGGYRLRRHVQRAAGAVDGTAVRLAHRDRGQIRIALEDVAQISVEPFEA